MFGRTAGLFAACALSATAFLITPDLSAPEADKAADFSIASFAGRHQLIAIPCSECALSSKQDVTETTHHGDASFWTHGANSLVLNFTVSQDGQVLEVNGEPIYPMGRQLQNMFDSPNGYIKQLVSPASLEEIESGKAEVTSLEVTGHQLAIFEEEAPSDNGDMLIPIRYNIFELEGQPVSLHEVIVHLMKTAAGELSILYVATTMSLPMLPSMDDAEVEDKSALSSHKEEESERFSVRPHSGRPHKGRPYSDHPHPGHHHSDHHESHKHGECKMPAVLCKFRHMIAGKLKGMRKGGCHGRKHGKTHIGKVPGHIKPHFSRPGMEHAHGRPQGQKAHGQHHHGRPHHMRPHGHHHGHHKHHFLGAFRRGLAAVLVPTMAGIAVGMAASFVGLVIGRLIAFLWIKFYRGGRRGYASVALEDEFSTEKELLIEEGIEVLPAYEEAPTYEDVAKDAKE